MTRGDIYRIRLPPMCGREQAGARYGVIGKPMSFSDSQQRSSRPTSRSAAPATFRPEIDLGNERTRVLVEQLRAIDVERLEELAGRLTPAEQQVVDDALALVLNL